MKTIKFSDISLDLHILDKFHQLTDQELVLDDNYSYNIWNTFWNDFRYDDNLGIYDIVELTLSHSYDYFTEEYYCEEDEDYIRQSIYIHNLELVRIWLRNNRLC